MTQPPELKETVKIPDGVELTIDQQHIIHVKGPKGTLSRMLSHPYITLTIKEKTVEILCTKSPHRKEKALVGTFKALINNMIKGVTQGYQYTMKTVFSHFPIKTTIEGNQFLIHNFLGERAPRRAHILENITVEIKGEHIMVSGSDKEKVGQTAANIERATKVKNRDIRVFQDGIYITSRKG